MTLKILSWNVMGNMWPPIRKIGASDKLKNFTYPYISDQILKTQPDIVCLQEAKTYYPLGLNQFLQEGGYEIVDDCGNMDGEWNQLVLAVRGDLLDRGTVNLENQTRIVGAKKIQSQIPSECVFADIRFNDRVIRIYNCHLRIKDQGISGRIGLLEQILKDACQFKGGVVVTGDFNNIVPEVGIRRSIVNMLHKQPLDTQTVNGKNWLKSEKYCIDERIKAYGFEDLLDLETSTFGIPLINWNFLSLKLDWCIVKNLQGTATLGSLVTDHRQVMAEIFV